MLAARSKKYAPTVENVQDRRSFVMPQYFSMPCKAPQPNDMEVWRVSNISKSLLWPHVSWGTRLLHADHWLPRAKCPSRPIYTRCCLHNSPDKDTEMPTTHDLLPSQKGNLIRIVLDSFSVPHYFDCTTENLNRIVQALQGPLELNCHILLGDWFLTLSHQVIDDFNILWTSNNC